jgi:hypothetical protein
MSKTLFVVLLLVGGILLVYGVDSANSVSSSVAQAVSGAPTDKTIWLIVAGIAGVAAGGLGIVLGRPS